MNEPNMDLARRFVDAHPAPGRLLMCAVTGSHHYGFNSPDSDIDLKGIHLAPTRQLLGLGGPPETHDRLMVFEDVECDLTTHEAGKALNLLLRGNGNVIERIASPMQLVETDALAALRKLAKGAVSKRFFRHYAGFFGGICREHAKAPAPTAKALLYAYRVALTGVHLLRTGEVEANLAVLAPRYGFEPALELVALKIAHTEKGTVPPDVDAAHRARWADLGAALSAARMESPLPDEPANTDACERWLVETRLAAVDE